MVAKNQALELQVEEASLTQIEHFVDYLCDLLKINDAYFGNILMSLTEFFNIVVDTSSQKKVNLTYNTDYQRLTINFYPVNTATTEALNSEVNLNNVVDSEINKRIFILNKLADKIITNDDQKVSLVFDISALHSLVYDDRKKKLQEFYRKKEEKKVTGTND